MDLVYLVLSFYPAKLSTQVLEAGKEYCSVDSVSVGFRNSIVGGSGYRDLRLFANNNPMNLHGIKEKRERMERIAKMFIGEKIWKKLMNWKCQ